MDIFGVKLAVRPMIDQKQPETIKNEQSIIL
jgi:hypothetical protein